MLILCYFQRGIAKLIIDQSIHNVSGILKMRNKYRVVRRKDINPLQSLCSIFLNADTKGAF